LFFKIKNIMSYLVDIVVRKPSVDGEKVPFMVMGAFDSMTWFMNKEDTKFLTELNRAMNNAFDTKDGLKNDGETTFERLMTAPCDVVLVVGEGAEFYVLEGRNPIDCSGDNGRVFRNQYPEGIAGYLKS